MPEYELKKGKIGEKVVGTYKSIETKFTNKFLEEDESSESGYTLKTGEVGEKVVSGYKKIEDGVVGSYKKIEDKFVDAFLEEKKDESDKKIKG